LIEHATNWVIPVPRIAAREARDSSLGHERQGRVKTIPRSFPVRKHTGASVFGSLLGERFPDSLIVSQPFFGSVLMAQFIDVDQGGHLTNLCRGERYLAERLIRSRVGFGELVICSFFEPAFRRTATSVTTIRLTATIGILRELDEYKTFRISKVRRPVKGNDAAAFL